MLCRLPLRACGAPTDTTPSVIEIVRAAPVERVPEKVAEPIEEAILRID